MTESDVITEIPFKYIEPKTYINMATGTSIPGGETRASLCLLLLKHHGWKQSRAAV